MKGFGLRLDEAPLTRESKPSVLRLELWKEQAHLGGNLGVTAVGDQKLPAAGTVVWHRSAPAFLDLGMTDTFAGEFFIMWSLSWEW